MSTALIIEDNEDNQVLITILLENSGYQVIKADTGEGGCRLAIEQEPDFILLDIQLPDCDGTEVLQRLRSTTATRNITIIAVTSHAMVGDDAALIAAGCDGYIEKPIDPERIIQQIQMILDKCK